MFQIQKIHEDIFQFLQKKRLDEPNLRYNLRFHNRDERLDKGYWFHGGKDVYVTFWDVWGKNKERPSPTIYFRILTDGTTELRIDERNKEAAKIWNGLSSILGLTKDPKNESKWFKKYSISDYIDSFESFFTKERPLIDAFLNNQGRKEDYPSFPEYEFNRNLAKIENIRKGINPPEFKNFEDNKLWVDCLQFENINAFNKENISFEKRVSCFIGKNGSGKTTILRGLALALVGSKDFTIGEVPFLRITETKQYPLYASEGNIDVFYTLESKELHNRIKFRSINNNASPLLEADEGQSLRDKNEPLLLNPKTLIIAFSQQTHEKPNQNNNGQDRSIKDSSKETSLNGAFPMVSDINSLILNKPDNRFKEFRKWLEALITANTPLDRAANKKVIDEIFDIINAIIKPKTPIRLASEGDTNIITPNNPKGIPMEYLSQGYQNVFAWLGFFMKRLYEYKSTLNIDDNISFSELPAVCFIDEIDTYIHPDWQYSLLSGLVEKFKNVQFFVTSHSPLVLSGVPSKDIAIFDIQSEGNEYTIVIKDGIKFNLYGADANRSTAFMSTKRKADIQEELDEIDNLLDENDPEAVGKLEGLSDKMYDLDSDIVRMKRAIRNKNLIKN